MGELKRPDRIEVEPDLTLEKIQEILERGQCTPEEHCKFTAKALELIRKNFAAKASKKS